MKYTLQDLIDIEHFQNLQDRLNGIYSFPSAIIDNDGIVLTATAWQDICTQFHRKNKETEKLCIKSDQYIKDHLHEANPAVSYRCPHGLVDNATPIIIDGIHYANFFTGQFFLEKPDLEFFRLQAGKYDFDEEAYLEAVKNVPIWTQNQLDSYLFFIKGLIAVISESGLKRLREIENRQQIEANEKIHKSILKTAMDGYWLMGTKGHLLEVNDSYCRMSGYSEADLLTMHVTDLEAIDDIYRIAKRIQYVTSVVSERFESKHRHKDGSLFDVEVSIQYRPEDGGQYVSFFRDITERKRIEKEIHEKDKALRLSLDAADAGTWTWNIQTGEVIWDDQMQKVFGMKPGTFDGAFDTWKKCVHPDDVDAAEKATLRAVLYGESYKHQYRIKGTKGDWRIVSAQAAVLVDENGKPLRMSGLAMDITERITAKEKLSRQKKLFETMFNTIPDGVIVTNTKREIVLANSGTEKTFGYTPDELLGKSTKMIYANEENFHQIGEFLFGEKSQRQSGRFITDYRNRKGLQFPGETFGAKLFDEQHLWLGNLGITRDITERLRQEEDWKKLQKQLAQAQKLEAIGVLAGGIAHDFNNILGAILGYAEMILDDCVPDSMMAKDIEQILTAGGRARDLVKQILAFSRQAEAENILLKPAKIVQEILKLLRATLPTTIAIEQSIVPETDLILADPTQIHQLIMNICTNAFHAMEEKGGTLTISLNNITLQEQDLVDVPNILPGKFIQLSVQDTGPGIPPEIKPRIFDPYFTTKAVGKGTGLGLAMAHGIISSYKGFIRCDSKVGEGTVFSIFIPVVDAPGKETEKSEETPVIFCNNEHILLIDDEETLVTMVQTMLERLGYRVTVRTSSLEALTTFKNEPDAFDLVITDQTMPGMTGFDLSRRMLQIRPELPIILCTGFSTSISEDKAKSSGIKGFAMKPITKQEIGTLIHKILSENPR